MAMLDFGIARGILHGINGLHCGFAGCNIRTVGRRIKVRRDRMYLAIETFAENVRHFCQWVESEPHDVQTARQLLLALMQGIPYLVVSDNQRDAEPEYPSRGHESWQVDIKRISDFAFQYYREVFSPCNVDDEPPVCGDVYDDLADIYGDLWHGLQAWDRGDGVYAVSYWRDSYFQHWGHHASSAIYAIDEYYRKTKNGEQDAAPNSRLLSQLPALPEVQSSDSLRTHFPDGCR